MLGTHMRAAAARWQFVGRQASPHAGLRTPGCLRGAEAARWRSDARPAPLLTAAPARCLVDEPISIKAGFLPPHRPVTLRARMRSEDGDLWEASGHYTSSADGTINLARDHSVGGSYLGCEPMGLFWSLHPAPESRDSLRLRVKNVELPLTVDISLLEGHVTAGDPDRAALAAVTTERWYKAPGVRRIDIRQDGVVGTLFLPPGPGKFPAVLDMWGMGGGLVEYRSALMASRGFANLSLAYMDHKELTVRLDCNNSNEYLKKAFGILRDHPQVFGQRIGVIGLSYGVYLALRIGTLTDVNPSCLVCVNGPAGTDMKVTQTFCQPQIAESDQRFWPRDKEGYMTFRDLSLPVNHSPGTQVKMENLACPLLYILGEDDQSSASAENSTWIADRLRAAGKSHLYTCLSYPGAGHLIEPPYSPHSRASVWKIRPEKVVALWGGQPAPHAAAQEDSWRNILTFLDHNLRS